MKKLAIVGMLLGCACIARAGLFDSVSKGLQSAAQSVERVGNDVSSAIQPNTTEGAAVKETTLPVCEVCGKVVQSKTVTRCPLHRASVKCSSCGKWINGGTVCVACQQSGKGMTSDEQRRAEWKKMQEENAALQEADRKQRAEEEANARAERYAAQQKAEQERLAKIKAEDDRVRAEEAKAQAAREADEKRQQAEEAEKKRKAQEALIAASRKDAEETKTRRERIRVNRAKEGEIKGTENIRNRVGEIFEEELKPLFERKKRALGYTDNYSKEDFIKDCCSGVSENSWLKKAHDYVPQAISFYQLGRFEDKMTKDDIKAELILMGYSDAQVGRLMTQYADWKEQGMGSDSQFLQVAKEQAPKKKATPKNYTLTKEDKKVNNEIRDVFAKKLSWRLKGKGSSDEEIKKLRETMIEQLMEYSSDVRLQRAEYAMNEIIRMYNLDK